MQKSVNEDKNLGSTDRDGETERGVNPERYGFVVFTGRHKILDYLKPDGQQIATADDEESARTIVRALNSYAALIEALEVLRSTLRPVLRDHEVRGNVDRTEGHVLVALNQIDAALAATQK